MTLVALSTQNQITIPALYLHQFGMKAPGKFLVDKKDDGLFLKPIKGSIVDELAGCLTKFIPKNRRNVPIDEAIRLGKLAMARHVAQS